MLRLLSQGYTLEDFKFLDEVLRKWNGEECKYYKMAEDFSTICDDCPAKRACADILKLESHVHNKVNELEDQKCYIR